MAKESRSKTGRLSAGPDKLHHRVLRKLTFEISESLSLTNHKEKEQNQQLLGMCKHNCKYQKEEESGFYTLLTSNFDISLKKN